MQPTIVYEADNNLILKNMVQNGAGVCLLPRSHAEPSDRVVYFSLTPNYHTNLTVMISKDHILSEDDVKGSQGEVDKAHIYPVVVV